MNLCVQPVLDRIAHYFGIPLITEQKRPQTLDFIFARQGLQDKPLLEKD